MHRDWEVKLECCSYVRMLLGKLQALVKENRLPIDLYVIKKAIYYAKTYHGMQMRDSGEPFYSHPLEVAYMLADYLPRTDLLVTAILHDTIEDTTLTKDMIAESFSQAIADKVEDLTRIKKDGKKISSKEMVESLWQQKKLDVLLIKLLDRLHNVLTIEAKSSEKIEKILIETLESFLLAAAYLEIKDAEAKFSKICWQYLAHRSMPSAELELVKQSIALASSEFDPPIVHFE